MERDEEGEEGGGEEYREKEEEGRRRGREILLGETRRRNLHWIIKGRERKGKNMKE